MNYRFLNDGNPLPETHKWAGQIGIELTFPDGSKQNIYGASQQELLDKTLKMYGNTRARNAELRSLATSATQNAPAQPAAPKRMTPEERMQATQDLSDPQKAPEAIASLLRDGTGFDPEAASRRDTQEDERVQLRGVVNQFMAENPEYYGSKKNGTLLRDRVAAHYWDRRMDVATWVAAYEELDEMGVLESAPETPEPPATQQPEPTPPAPSAPAPARVPGTGIPPTSRTSGQRPVSGQKLTRQEVLDMAHKDPSGYERRLRSEPGFAEKVNKALEPNG